MKLSTILRSAVLAVAIGVMYQATSHAGYCSFKGSGVLTSTLTAGGNIEFRGVYLDSGTVNIPYAELHYTLSVASGSVSGNETGNGTKQPRQVILNTTGSSTSTRLTIKRGGGNNNNGEIKGTIELFRFDYGYFSGFYSGYISCN